MDNLTNALLLALAVGSCTYLFYAKMGRRRRSPRGLALPPGPRRLPVLGNMLQVNKGKSWEAYNDLSKKYGS